jgi:hypothetical protein
MQDIKFSKIVFKEFVYNTQFFSMNHCFAVNKLKYELSSWLEMLRRNAISQERRVAKPQEVRTCGNN